MPTAETEMQNAAAQYVNDYNQFLQAYNTPEYTNPAAFTSNMIAYARTLCMHSWSVYTCAGFDPVSAGTKYANLVFSKLQQIAVNPNDPASISVYAKWLASPPSVTPDYTPPAPVTQPFTPSALPPAIVATLPPAVVNYVPPSPAPVSGAPAPASSPVPLPAVQTWFPPIAGGSTAGAAAPSFNLGFLTNKISIFGYGVPMWALLAGGVGVVVVAQSAGGRR
jgi:hypothetical protein